MKGVVGGGPFGEECAFPGLHCSGAADRPPPCDLTVDVERAKEILFADTDLSSRDAVHVATRERLGIDIIMSFYTGFDAYPGVTRLAD